MPKDIVTTVYTYAELKALGNPLPIASARLWLAGVAIEGEWWESTYEDAKNIGAEIQGFDVTRGGSIDFRLNLDAISAALRIRENHGKDFDTHKLAVGFISKHDEYHGVNGKITLADSAGDVEALNAAETEWETIEADFTHALCEEYLSMLRQKLEYIQGEEYLADMAEANEYTFTVNGKRFG